MANCRSCGIEIPEGSVYCNECEERMKADESYLDSLLSSVVANSAEIMQERPQVKTTAEPVESVFSSREAVDEFPVLEEVPEEELSVMEEIQGMESFPVYEDVAQEDVTFPVFEELQESEALSAYEEEQQEDVSISAFESEMPEDDAYSIFAETDDSYLDNLFAEDAESPEESEPFFNEEAEVADESVAEEFFDEIDAEELRREAAEFDYAAFASADDVAESIAVAEDNFEAVEEVAEEPLDIGYSDTFADDELDMEAMLAGEALAEEVFSMPQFSEEVEETATEEDPFAIFGIETPVEEQAPVSEPDDIMNFWNLVGGEGEQEISEMDSSDFADGLQDIFGSDVDYMDLSMAAAQEKEAVAEEIPEAVKPKKKSLFARLFGNVREDLTPEQIEERKRIALEKFEEDELRAAEESAREKQNKEERAKQKEEEAAQKLAEKEILAKKKAEEKLLKAEEKRIRKDKKEQAKRALLAEIEENEGKINKFGASIIIVMFAAILCLITMGASYYNYKISIDKAQFDFDLQRYDDAYNDVYGLEIKEEDMELYDKIMTVQYVNVQLLSYMRYNSLDMDAEALDSLMKGLRRYETFIQHGTELGVKEDLNYLKKQIVQQLHDVFGITEEDAYTMLALESQDEYSLLVYDIVSNLQ